jgi:hypothetical protein
VPRGGRVSPLGRSSDVTTLSNIGRQRTSESETLRPDGKGLGTVRGYLHPRRARTYTVRYRIYLGHDKQSGSARVVDYKVTAS